MAYDSHYWLDRAEEVRAKADMMTGADTRRSMLTIAESYYCMAERATELERLERERIERRKKKGLDPLPHCHPRG